MRYFLLITFVSTFVTACMTEQDKIVWEEFKVQAFEKPENPSLLGDKKVEEGQYQSKNEKTSETAR